MSKQNSVDEDEIMTDADFERAMQALQEEGNEEVNELLMAMSENRIISWDEAERILGETSNEPVKSSLPQQTRPTEPDNDTDVTNSTQRLAQNDPKLVEINLNNMKRTPVPQIKRLIEAIRDNEHLEKLSLANMGLYDMDLQPLIDVVEHNTTLRCINLETNYLSGDFFAKLFKAALTNQSLEEVKAVNQGVAFSTQTEREIIDAITANRGLTKVSINLRLSEGRFKVEQATIRNQEIRRILRRQMLAEQQQKTEEKPPKAPAASSKKAFVPKGAVEEEEKKPPLKRQPSGATAELAKQRTNSGLAIAGVATPRASTSEEESTGKTKAPSITTKPSAVRDQADEEKAKKPYEIEKTAERAILAEKAKQKTTAGRWPPEGVAAQKSVEEEKGTEEGMKKGATGKGGSSWRDRMAKKAKEEPAEKQERKGSLALRDKFEQKGKATENEEPAKKTKPKLGGTGGEKLSATRGKFEQKNNNEEPKEKAEIKEKANAGNKEGEEGEKKTIRKKIVKRKEGDDGKKEESDKKMPQKIVTNELSMKKPATGTNELATKKTAGFTPSWRERLNK